MLTRLNENLKLNNNLNRPHKGLVVLTDAAETTKLGRIKVRIRGLIEETDTTKLPWIYPQASAGLGGKPNLSSFAVPEIGSEVTVVFPFDSVYAPFYIGHWVSAKTMQNELFAGANYPEVYGFVDSQIQWIKVDKSTNETEIYNQQGELLLSLSSGKLLVNVKSGIQINVSAGDVDIKASGDLNLEAGGAVNIKAGTSLSTLSTTNTDIKATTNINMDGVLIKENTGASGSASGATVTDATTAKSDADALATSIDIPTGIGGFD